MTVLPYLAAGGIVAAVVYLARIATALERLARAGTLLADVERDRHATELRIFDHPTTSKDPRA